MNTRRLTLVALIAFCLTLVGTQDARAADKDDAFYTVIIKKVEVQKTKKDGSSWDIMDGKPDLAVIVRNASEKDSKSFQTKTKDDVFSAEFNEPTTIKFKPGQTIEFEVIDVDVAVNDLIGKIRKEMTAEVLKTGKLKLEKFEQVILLEVELKKL